MNSSTPNLIFGQFSAEKTWKPEHEFSLPSITDKHAEGIVSVLDEIMFIALASDKDLLVNRKKFSVPFKQYLNGIGLNFKFTSLGVDTPDIICKENDLLNYSALKKIVGNLDTPHNLKLYAITPGADMLRNSPSLNATLPDLETVKKVNSKVYSQGLAEQLGIGYGSKVCRSVSELDANAEKFMDNQTPFLLKGAFGVSGSEIFVIQDQTRFSLIRRTIEKHLRKNPKHKLSLIIEPLLDKAVDISCQFTITEQGTIRILSTHQIKNDAFKFTGICYVDKEVEAILNQSGYYEKIEKLGQQLFADGYFGEVCVDSLILKDNSVIPIIEINARMSMGFLNHYVYERLSLEKDSNSHLGISNVLVSPDFTYERFLQTMQDEDILYTRKKGWGILPLSANTLLVNVKETDERNKYRGRLYYSAITSSKKSYTTCEDGLKKVFRKMQIDTL